VNHFLDHREKRLQFEVAIVPLAIDKKYQRTVHPAAHAAGKVPLHTLGKSARP
jgi:transcriptional regulator with GAF, ATPase, and Fis domain